MQSINDTLRAWKVVHGKSRAIWGQLIHGSSLLFIAFGLINGDVSQLEMRMLRGRRLT